MTNDEKRARLLEWADVLESGKYKQARGCWYETSKQLCCLGVALVHFENRLPNDVRRQVHVSAIFGETPSWADQFVHMNDKLELTFPEIASEIRKMADAL